MSARRRIHAFGRLKRLQLCRARINAACGASPGNHALPTPHVEPYDRTSPFCAWTSCITHSSHTLVTPASFACGPRRR